MYFLNPVCGRSENLGALLRLPCSACEKVQWFYLKRHTAFVRFLFIEFSKISSCAIHCEKCGYEIAVASDDVEKAIEFLPVARSFAAGRLPETVFLSKLGEVEFEFLKQFVAAKTNWTCLGCGEESPLTFSSCWKCGAAHDSAQQYDVTQSKTPYLDKVLRSSAGPFGSIDL